MFVTAGADEDPHATAPADRPLGSRFRGWTGGFAPTRSPGPMRQIGEPVGGRLPAGRNSEFGGLALAWLTFLGLSAALGGTLQALGPPSANPPEPARSAAAATPRPESIAALLGKVEDAITDNPDGAPPGTDSAQALQRVAAALPGASPEDRQLAKDMASDLFDRARIALNAGKVADEQRWLALGAILAPPPDLAPAADNAPQPSGAGKSGTRQEFTPNETEAEATPTAPAQQAGQAGSGNSPSADKAAAAQAPAQNSADANAAPAGLAIHVAASSAAAGATAKTLAERLGSGVRTQTVASSEAPPGAVVCYANPDDHARAKAIGEMLGGLGYYWRLQRGPTTQAAAVPGRIDVWLPPGESKQRPPSALSDNYCRQ